MFSKLRKKLGSQPTPKVTSTMKDPVVGTDACEIREVSRIITKIKSNDNKLSEIADRLGVPTPPKPNAALLLDLKSEAQLHEQIIQDWCESNGNNARISVLIRALTDVDLKGPADRLSSRFL